MAKVFLSHAGRDDSIATEISKWLTAWGHELFLDHDFHHGVVVGEEWEQRLHERVRWADAMVCIVTPAYVSSTWCSAAARSRGTLILPISGQPGQIHPLLGYVHHVDLTKDKAVARRYLEDALRRIDRGGGRGWPDERSPFPGLRPYESDMHQAFFGRSREVAALVEIMRSPAEPAVKNLIVLVGPSGCGKSSLLRAGLHPVMADKSDWLSLSPILPGSNPVAVLTGEIARTARKAGLSWSLEDVRSRLSQGGLWTVAQELLLADGQGHARHLLVPIDQFDELMTLAGAGEREAFVDLIRPALGGVVRIVVTLRTEFLDSMLTDPALGQLPMRSELVRPISKAELPEVIRGPARLARLEVDDDLVARMVNDTEGGDALPLLAFTLSQLAESVVGGEGRRQLTRARYDDLNGVQGALVRQADAALAEAAASSGRKLVRPERGGGHCRPAPVGHGGRAWTTRKATSSA